MGRQEGLGEHPSVGLAHHVTATDPLGVQDGAQPGIEFGEGGHRRVVRGHHGVVECQSLEEGEPEGCPAQAAGEPEYGRPAAQPNVAPVDGAHRELTAVGLGEAPRLREHGASFPHECMVLARDILGHRRRSRGRRFHGLPHDQVPFPSPAGARQARN